MFLAPLVVELKPQLREAGSCVRWALLLRSTGWLKLPEAWWLSLHSWSLVAHSQPWKRKACKVFSGQLLNPFFKVDVFQLLDASSAGFPRFGLELSHSRIFASSPLEHFESEFCNDVPPWTCCSQVIELSLHQVLRRIYRGSWERLRRKRPYSPNGQLMRHGTPPLGSSFSAELCWAFLASTLDWDYFVGSPYFGQLICYFGLFL